MPVSNDNQDYKNKENIKESQEQSSSGNSGEKNQQQSSSAESQNQFTSDDLKGKKVDRDFENDKEEPLDR